MRPMTNTADKNSKLRGTGGASDKEDHIKEREDLSEDLAASRACSNSCVLLAI